MKIRLVGSRGKERLAIRKVVQDLNCSADIEEIDEMDKFKYHIKKTPAIIIENIIISEDSKLSMKELKEVLYQFIET